MALNTTTPPVTPAAAQGNQSAQQAGTSALHVLPGTTNTTMGAAFQQAQAPQQQNPMAQAAFASQNPQPNNAIGFGVGWSFLDGNIPGSIGAHVGNEQINGLKEKMEECYKNSPHAKNIRVFILDNENYKQFYFTTMLVTYYGGKGTGVSYIPLIMESSNLDVPTYTDNSTGIPVEIFRAPGDAYDADLVAVTTQFVSKEYPNEPVRSVEAIVVPRNFDVLDRNKVANLALVAGNAVGLKTLMANPNFTDLDLSVVKKNDSIKEINITFARQQLVSTIGDPIRSDFTVNFIAKAHGNQNQNNRSLNGGQRINTISAATGFFDLVYSPSVPPEMAMYQYMTGQFNPAMYKKWVPRAIITDIQTSFSYTPANVLLSILTVASIRDGMNWIQAFRPSGNRGGVDLHDVGALNFEANLPNVEGFDQSSRYGRRKVFKGGDNQGLFQFITTVMQTLPIISIDVPETGPQTWYLGLIAAAASGNPGAVNAFIKSLDTLTGGNFSKIWATVPDKTMFVDQGNRIQLGYYTADDGTLHDIRDWDYLAVANVLGDNNPDLIAEWSDTFYSSNNVPQDLRLSRRRKMLMEMTGGTAVFTGHAQRITFSAALIQTALAAVNNAGLSANTRCTNVGDVGYGRGVANFATMAMLSPAAITFNPYNQNNGGMGSYGGYWGATF